MYLITTHDTERRTEWKSKYKGIIPNKYSITKGI